MAIPMMPLVRSICLAQWNHSRKVDTENWSRMSFAQEVCKVVRLRMMGGSFDTDQPVLDGGLNPEMDDSKSMMDLSLSTIPIWYYYIIPYTILVWTRVIVESRTRNWMGRLGTS
eukprot:scaffold11728_cov171-Amphora_coffeaeformis.AAC.2